MSFADIGARPELHATRRTRRARPARCRRASVARQRQPASFPSFSGNDQRARLRWARSRRTALDMKARRARRPERPPCNLQVGGSYGPAGRLLARRCRLALRGGPASTTPTGSSSMPGRRTFNVSARVRAERAASWSTPTRSSSRSARARGAARCSACLGRQSARGAGTAAAGEPFAAPRGAGQLAGAARTRSRRSCRTSIWPRCTRWSATTSGSTGPRRRALELAGALDDPDLLLQGALRDGGWRKTSRASTPSTS